MATISVIQILECYTEPKVLRSVRLNSRIEYSVWILPGPTVQYGRDSPRDFEDYISEHGVRVAERIDEESANKLAADIETKFKSRGFVVETEIIAND